MLCTVIKMDEPLILTHPDGTQIRVYVRERRGQDVALAVDAPRSVLITRGRYEKTVLGTENGVKK